MHRYLRDENYYSERYDLLTIEACLRHLELHRIKSSSENSDDEFLTNLSKEDKGSALKFASNFGLYLIKGERYKNKSTFVHESMMRDSQRDEIFKNAQGPRDIRCTNCLKGMRVILKELYEFDDKPTRVLFLFECPTCAKRNGYFDNGEEFKSKRELCPKCNFELKVSCLDQGDSLFWSKECSACGYIEKEEDDFNKMQSERIAAGKNDQELLRKYRIEFCMSETEGYQYLQDGMNLKMLADFVENQELKSKDPDYKEAASLNRWSVVKLEEVLSQALAKENFKKLALEKPEIDKYVIVPFTVQDFSAARGYKDSECELQKLIKMTLIGSNWRLMTDGVSCRLGCLSGRLKGYEREEDLVKLIKQEKER